MEKKQGDLERDRQYCELCGKMENLLKCGRCRISFYCSKEHQKQDWKKHKLNCKEPQLPKQKPGQTQLTGEDAKITSEKTDSAFPSTTEAPGVGDKQGEDGANETSTPNGQSSASPQKLAAEYIVPCMNKHGICVVDNFLGADIGQSILENVKALHSTGKFSDGQLVSQKGDSTKDIRGDKITWIEGKEAGCDKIRFLMGRMDDLIRHCNGKLGNYTINGRTKVSICCRKWTARRRYCKHTFINSRNLYFCMFVSSSSSLLRAIPRSADSDAHTLRGWQVYHKIIALLFDYLVMRVRDIALCIVMKFLELVGVMRTVCGWMTVRAHQR